MQQGFPTKLLQVMVSFLIPFGWALTQKQLMVAAFIIKKLFLCCLFIVVKSVLGENHQFSASCMKVVHTRCLPPLLPQHDNITLLTDTKWTEMNKSGVTLSTRQHSFHLLVHVSTLCVNFSANKISKIWTQLDDKTFWLFWFELKLWGLRLHLRKKNTLKSNQNIRMWREVFTGLLLEQPPHLSQADLWRPASARSSQLWINIICCRQ